MPPVLVAVWLGGLAFAILLAFIGGGIGYELSCMASIKSNLRTGVMILIGSATPIVALFAGSWHGTHDFLLVDDKGSNTPDKPEAFLRSAGSPEELLDLIIFDRKFSGLSI